MDANMAPGPEMRTFRAALNFTKSLSVGSLRPSVPAHEVPRHTALLDQLCSIYDQSVANLRKALGAYCEDGAHPDPELRANGCFAYPELRVAYSGERTAGRLTRAFARLTAPGNYACSVARPALFRDYLKTQLEHLVGDYGVQVSVGKSRSEIPYAYTLDGSGINLDDVTAAELSRWFPSNELVHIGDEIAEASGTIRSASTAVLCSRPAPIQPRPVKAVHGTDPIIPALQSCQPTMSLVDSSSGSDRRAARETSPPPPLGARGYTTVNRRAERRLRARGGAPYSSYL